MSDDLKTVRLPFMVTHAEAEAIDEWRYAHKVPTRAEAMRRLIQIGIEDEKKNELIRQMSAIQLTLIKGGIPDIDAIDSVIFKMMSMGISIDIADDMGKYASNLEDIANSVAGDNLKEDGI